MLWNEPNNLSHWNFELDPQWRRFAALALEAAAAVRAVQPRLLRVLGGISPIDPEFIRLLAGQGVLEAVERVAVHGFPLDWNHWNIYEWPRKIAEIEAASGCPVWVSEAGASSFGAEEIQVFGLETTARLLAHRVERVHWYSLFDLPSTWPATTRHQESEGSAYYRHYYMGLIRADGTPKPAAAHFPAGIGICQWFHFEDPRLAAAADWMRKLGVTHVRTGLSWADWYRPGAVAWFDRQMQALENFQVTLTLCYTPAHLGLEPHYAAPPRESGEFSRFAAWVAQRYGAAAMAEPAEEHCVVEQR
ncbi:MAG: beta-xylosidase, partial [Terriglobales bacterium]